MPSPPRRDRQRCLQRRRWASRRLRCPHQHAQKTQSILNGCWRKRQPQENRPLCQALLGGSEGRAKQRCAQHTSPHVAWRLLGKKPAASAMGPFCAAGCKPVAPAEKKNKPLPHLRSSKCFHICPSPQRDTRAVGEGSRRSLGSSAGKVKEDLFATVGGTVSCEVPALHGVRASQR